jgi:Leucine-rich repeat (LRR) protein
MRAAARRKLSPIAQAVASFLGLNAAMVRDDSLLIVGEADISSSVAALEHLAATPAKAERFLWQVVLERDLAPDWIRHRSGRESVQPPATGENAARGVLAPLSSLGNLMYLGLAGLPVCDLSPLSNLKNLVYLDLSGSACFDLAPLANLNRLQSLRLGRCFVESLAPLCGLKELLELQLWGASISDISPLASLGSLRLVDLAATEVLDFSPLHSLHKLQVLRVSHDRGGRRRGGAPRAEQLKALGKAIPGLKVYRVG